MRWVGTSWKMTKTKAEARSFASRLTSALSGSLPAEVQPFVIPPFTAIDTVVGALGGGSRVVVGAQNVHWEDAGAWTGEISAPMLADAGVGLVEIGHSERRAAFAETDETVGLKVAAALRHGLRPLICVGEPGEVFESGRSTEFVLAQARAALCRIEDRSTVLLAYEPIWAIGEHGREPDPAEIETTMIALRNEFVTGSADPVAGILYGGSVNEINAAGLLDVPGVDGLFVGRAAWDVEGYLALLTIASSTAGVRTRTARKGPERHYMTDLTSALPAVLDIPGAAARIREHNKRTGRRLAVLDDDPTGSQAVHGVSVVTVLERSEYAEGLAEPGDTCFILTNTRAIDESQAVALNKSAAYDLYTLAAETGSTVEVVSRSDSTLRGHVLAEIETVAAEHQAVTGRPVDGVLFCPAMLEAGRFTADNVHYARVDGVAVPVGETEFAKDKTFGYSSSNLCEFIEERSGGSIAAEDVYSLSLADIRLGGPERVAEILTGVSELGWVVVNVTEYADLEVVVLGLQIARDAGKTFLARSGPSFVRALAGIEAKEPLSPADIAIDSSRARHGLIAVGSHVGLTTRQVRAAQKRGGLVEVELHVPTLLDPDSAAAHLDEAAQRVIAALPKSDVLLYTSRDLVAVNDDPDASLDISRTVSTALVTVAQLARTARPAWVIAKGGITSHDVAVRGLGIRRATVAGQFLPGQISLFAPVEAPADVLGCPYVVFPGNVGGVEALAEVRDRLEAATEGAR